MATDIATSVATSLATSLCIEEPVVPSYTLTFESSVGGSLDRTSFTGHTGDTVTVTATANEHYSWAGWNDSMDNPRTFTVGTESKTYLASFIADPRYELTFTVVNGACHPTSYEGWVGDQVMVVVNPEGTYTFQQWDDGNTENPRLFTIGNESKTYTATCG